MILERHPGFLSADQLSRVNRELETVPRWIFRNVYPNNFWRYYILDDLVQYDEQQTVTWYGHQQPSLLERLSGIWRELFDLIYSTVGPNFVLQRYTINGQTLGQDGVLHTDVTATRSGIYRSYLCYLNREWDQSWGGATEILGPSDLVEHEYPEPGTLIVFDSQCLHRGLAPLRSDLLRITMLWHGQHMAV